MTRPSSRILVPVAAILVLAASAGSGQNLLQNPHFDTSLDGWTPSVPLSAAVWDQFDRNGDAESGSALATGLQQQPEPFPMWSGAWINQCVPVLPGQPYVFGASVWLDSEVPELSAVGLAVTWVLAPDCNGPSIPESVPVSPILGQTWTDVRASRAAPLRAVSAIFSVGTSPLQLFEPRIYVDEAFFVPGESRDVAPSQGGPPAARTVPPRPPPP